MVFVSISNSFRRENVISKASCCLSFSDLVGFQIKVSPGSKVSI